MLEKKKFIDIAPRMAEAGDRQGGLPGEVVDLIVALTQNEIARKPGASKQARYDDLKVYLMRTEFVALAVIKLAATLARLCEQLADGTDKDAVRTYLTYLISIAINPIGQGGRGILTTVTEFVQMELDGYPHRLIRPW